jgi:hypothetical protein
MDRDRGVGASHWRNIGVEENAMNSTVAESLAIWYSDSDEFGCWCHDELFSLSKIRAAALLEYAYDLYLSQLYRSLGMARHLETAKTSSQLTLELGYVESASIALEAMLCESH